MEHWPHSLCADSFDMCFYCSYCHPYEKDIELLLIVWSIFVLIFTIKGYWQKNHGFSEKDLHFLYALGGWRTHLIWSGIRYFSCFSDAANYGVHAALSAVVFAISSFYAGSKWKRVYFSSSLSARFMGWEYPEQEQQWESSWAVC